MKQFARRVVQARWFEPWMVGLILFNALIIGLETSHEVMREYGPWLELGNDVILGVFVLEAALKITAVAPQIRRYFGDGWNLFDFTVIGPAVNLAERIETLCPILDQPLLASRQFASICGSTLKYLGSHPLRGFAEPQDVFGLP